MIRILFLKLGFLRTAGLGLLASLAAATPPVVRPCADDDAFVQLLVELVHADEDVRAGARLRLDALGANAIPDLLGLLSGRLRPVEGARGPVLPPAVYDEVTAMLRGERTDVLVARTRATVGSSAPLAERLEAVRLLGATADADALSTILFMLGGESSAALGHPRIAGVVAQAIAGVLERDLRGHGVLGAELPKIPAGLRPAVVDALGRVNGPFGVALLDRLTVPGLVPDVLGALARWDPWSAEALNGSCGDLARSYLSADDPRLCRRAAATLGELRDPRSIDALIDLLEDADPRVRRAAHWSLKRITGRSWSAAASRWRRWRAAEATWFQERSGKIAQELEGDMASAVNALQELAEHGPLDRALLEEVVVLLDHRRTPVAVAAATALLRLGDPAAVEGLLFAVDERRIPVREAAHAALVKITGAAPAAVSSEAWRTVLGI